MAIVKNTCVILLIASFAISCSTDESENDTIPLHTDVLTAQEVQLILETDQLSWCCRSGTIPIIFEQWHSR